MSKPGHGLTTGVRVALTPLRPGESILLPWPEGADRRRWRTGVSAVASQMFGAGAYATRQSQLGVRVERRAEGPRA